MFNPRYWPCLSEERRADGEECGGDAVVVSDEAPLFPPLGIATLIPLVALPDGGVGEMDVDAAAAEPPIGETLAPAASDADDATGGGGGAAPPPAA
jgi:hypothetical protein